MGYQFFALKNQFFFVALFLLNVFTIDLSLKMAEPLSAIKLEGGLWGKIVLFVIKTRSFEELRRKWLLKAPIFRPGQYLFNIFFENFPGGRRLSYVPMESTKTDHEQL